MIGETIPEELLPRVLIRTEGNVVNAYMLIPSDDPAAPPILIAHINRSLANLPGMFDAWRECIQTAVAAMFKEHGLTVDHFEVRDVPRTDRHAGS